MRPFKSWYDWLGVFAAGLSLFHFFVHVQHLHVTVMIKEILHYYRMLFYPFASFVDGLIGQIFIRIFGWSVSIPRDFLILYALGTGCLYRSFEPFAKDHVTRFPEQKDDKDLSSRWFRFLVSLFWPVFVFLFLILIIQLIHDHRESALGRLNAQDEANFIDTRARVRDFFLPAFVFFWREVLIAAIVMCAFVAINASGLSLF